MVFRSDEPKKLKSVVNEILFVGELGIGFVAPIEVDEVRSETKGAK
jgi:hypothetical protein